jgi:hypothetical protein
MDLGLLHITVNHLSILIDDENKSILFNGLKGKSDTIGKNKKNGITSTCWRSLPLLMKLRYRLLF